MENFEAKSNSPNLLQSLINASEKASNIARLCRSNQKLLSMLVQEKIGDEANSRFQHDFKTLADVLIQETIKKDIGASFPAMRDAIKGEESPNFTNKDGTKISIEIGQTISETSSCLEAVMQDYEAAEALAAEAHRVAEYTGADLGEVPTLPEDLNYANLGIWIDPIDATAEYISGYCKLTNFPDIAAAGLDCVTVLIGVYERDSGHPVIGVISQPFIQSNEERVSYTSRLFWGVALPQLKAHNCSIDASASRRNPLVICSSSEQIDVLNTLRNAGCDTVFSAGAGHKALKVITNDADIYVLSKGSTFKWDTCAPQAILRALNGDIFDYKETSRQKILVPIKYSDHSKYEDDDIKCNSGGIIAVRDLNFLQKILPKFV